MMHIITDLGNYKKSFVIFMRPVIRPCILHVDCRPYPCVLAIYKTVTYLYYRPLGSHFWDGCIRLTGRRRYMDYEAILSPHIKNI